MWMRDLQCGCVTCDLDIWNHHIVGQSREYNEMHHVKVRLYLGYI